MNLTPEQLVGFAVAFASGGLAGAVLTLLVSGIRQRRELALKTFDKYLTEFGPLANCHSYLGDATYATDLQHFNEIRRIGDWLEVTALLMEKKYMQRRFVDELGLIDQMRKFHETITREKNKPASVLNDAWLWWPALDRLIRKG